MVLKLLGKVETLPLLLIHLGIRIITADLILRPEDTEAVVGFPTFLNCSTTLSGEIQWFHYRDGDTQQRNLVYGYNKFYQPYEGRFQIEKDETKGAYNLVIARVAVEDFGKYQCQDDFGKGVEGSAQLVVLESQPTCESSMKPEGLIGPNMCGMKPDDLHLSCSVQYRGNQPPSIVWIKTGSEIVITEGVTPNISTNQAIYDLTLKSTVFKDGDSFECRTTNSAMMQYGCTSQTVKVNGCKYSNDM